MVAQENAAVKPQPYAQNDGKREKKSEPEGMLSGAVDGASASGGICDEKLVYGDIVGGVHLTKIRVL